MKTTMKNGYDYVSHLKANYETFEHHWQQDGQAYSANLYFDKERHWLVLALHASEVLEIAILEDDVDSVPFVSPFLSETLLQRMMVGPHGDGGDAQAILDILGLCEYPADLISLNYYDKLPS